MSGLNVTIGQEDIDLPEDDPTFTIAGVINDIDIAILELKNELGNSVRDIIAGDGKVGDYINTSILILAGLATILTVGSKAAWAVDIRSGFAAIKTNLATFLDSVGVRLLITTHNLLMSVWEQYAALFEDIYNAAAGVSSSLGYGMEFIPLALNNAESVLLATAPLIGRDPEEMKIDFLGTAAVWVDKLDNNFKKWANNPGAILSDLNDYIKLESEKEYTSKFGRVIATVDGVVDIVDETTNDIFVLEDRFNTLIEDLPGEIFGAIQEKWADVDDKFVSFRDEYVVPLISVIQAGIDEVMADFAIQRMSNEDIRALLRSIPDMLSGVFIDTSEAGDRERAVMFKLINKGLFLGAEDDPEPWREVLDGLVYPVDNSNMPKYEPVTIEDDTEPLYVQLAERPIQSEIYETISQGVGDNSGSGIIAELGDV